MSNFENIGKILIEKGISIASAESCTGGMFAAALTDIPGISAVFDRTIVSYSNRAKMEELGVKSETLEHFGAVSEETAREMAEGLHRVSGCDLCISVTGIAGPGGGSPEKPVGLVYMGLYYKGKTVVKKVLHGEKSRKDIREGSVRIMFEMVEEIVNA